jgi:hypothetical protein
MPKKHKWSQNASGRAKYLAAAVRIRISGVMLCSEETAKRFRERVARRGMNPDFVQFLYSR